MKLRTGHTSKSFYVFCLGSTLILSNCAHLDQARKSRESSASEVSKGGVPAVVVKEESLPKMAPLPSTPTTSSGIQWKIAGVELKNTQFDIPVTLNSQVEHWVEYFTGRGRKHFERYLERSEYFIPYIDPILVQNQMPRDLVYLAMIESGFNYHAKSKAKAVGPWQFIQYTGKKYGLDVNWWVDERRHIQKSTEAASKYLRDLYSAFQSWELAAAAYNAGEGKVTRAIRMYGVQDFWTLARQRYLKPETRNYVPKLMAAAIVVKNRTLFGFPASYLNRPTSQISTANSSKPISEEVPSALAEYDDESTDEDDPTEETVVVKSEPESDEDLEGDAATPKVFVPHVDKKTGAVSENQVAVFEVESPADLYQIAKAAGLTYEVVKSLNPEILRWCTPPGKGVYQVKLPLSAKLKFLETYNSPGFDRTVEFRRYTVKRGDSIKAIARRFGFSPDPIRDLNRINHDSQLKVGSQIKLPLPEDSHRSLASLDVIDPVGTKHRRRGQKDKSIRSKRPKSGAVKISIQERKNAQNRPKRNSI